MPTSLSSTGQFYALHDYLVFNIWCGASCFLLSKALQLAVVHLIYGLSVVLTAAFLLEHHAHDNGAHTAWSARSAPIFVSMCIIYVGELYVYAFLQIHPLLIYGCYVIMALITLYIPVRIYWREHATRIKLAVAGDITSTLPPYVQQQNNAMKDIVGKRLHVLVNLGAPVVDKSSQQP
jgi:hypothetical protein